MIIQLHHNHHQNSFTIYIKKFDSDDETIVLTISSELSGTFQSARIASEEINQKIEIIDSKLATISNKLIIKNAVELRDKGCSFEEIVSRIKNDINKIVLYAGFNTLEYLVKGGRLSKVAGVAGTILKIKPLVTLSNGKIEMIKKSRGFTSLIQDIISRFSEDNIDLDAPIMIGYTKDDSSVELIKKFLEDKGYTNISYTEIGAVIGVHAGPGAAAISYFKK